MVSISRLDVGFKSHLMLLLRALRNPTAQPPVNAELTRRQDEVARRLYRKMPGDPTLKRMLTDADQSVRGH